MTISISAVSPSPTRRRRLRETVIPRILWPLGVAFVIGWAAFNMAMLAWVILGSFRAGSSVFTKPFALPERWSFANYANAWVTSELGVGFFNSVLLVTLAS